ncbi:MAG: 16S rRNA (cytosine(1402)-N(4))-methyltransferase RsmH [Puniceicoccales bacterium]|jgi:16S rRNA (cytosine1402-N4)-methyltransferase|nr:16S rRNA (cytosine(1402)-N(4))-methyltransferase RsmH [Puniceicoccales bacterium]
MSCVSALYSFDIGRKPAMRAAQEEQAMGETTHIPVLVSAILEAFRRTDGRTFLDCTLGGGGHSRAILETFPNAKLWAMDADAAAIERARISLPADRAHIYHGNFVTLDKLPQRNFDGILLDLGVSSDQLENGERGFSFRLDGPMDMRMDRSCGRTAEEFLETESRSELIEAIRNYGEEPLWKKIVDAIEAARGTGKLSRTGSFAELVRRVLPTSYRTKIDPATRAFQGIRIAVNGELNALKEALPKAFAALEVGGVLAVISFHSLEDRIVKQYFREWSGLPVDQFDSRTADERVARGQLLVDKPIVPDVEEILRNPRSRSAKLRLFRKGEEEFLGGGD